VCQGTTHGSTLRLASRHLAWFPLVALAHVKDLGKVVGALQCVPAPSAKKLKRQGNVVTQCVSSGTSSEF